MRFAKFAKDPTKFVAFGRALYQTEDSPSTVMQPKRLLISQSGKSAFPLKNRKIQHVYDTWLRTVSNFLDAQMVNTSLPELWDSQKESVSSISDYLAQVCTIVFS